MGVSLCQITTWRKPTPTRYWFSQVQMGTFHSFHRVRLSFVNDPFRSFLQTKRLFFQVCLNDFKFFFGLFLKNGNFFISLNYPVRLSIDRFVRSQKFRSFLKNDNHLYSQELNLNPPVNLKYTLYSTETRMRQMYDSFQTDLRIILKGVG